MGVLQLYTETGEQNDQNWELEQILQLRDQENWAFRDLSKRIKRGDSNSQIYDKGKRLENWRAV